MVALLHIFRFFENFENFGFYGYFLGENPKFSKISNFGGQKLKILKNRDSHFVELVNLRLLAFFICILVQKCVFDRLRKIGCFWAKNRL